MPTNEDSFTVMWDIIKRAGWSGWVFLSLIAGSIGWVLNNWAPILAAFYLQLFEWIYFLLPEELQTVIHSYFQTWGGTILLPITRIALWILDQFLDTTIALTIITLYLTIIPISIAIRLAFWLYGKVPVIGKGAS